MTATATMHKHCQQIYNCVKWAYYINTSSNKGNIMGKWQVNCSCGDNFEVEAETKEEAMEAMKMKMTPDVVAGHWAEKHAGEEMPSEEQMMGMLDSIHEVM